MITFNLYLLRTCLFSAVVLLFFTNNALAQSNLKLVITEDPDSYVASVLDDIEAEGMSTVRGIFEGMGLNSPQNEAAISVYQSHESPSQKRWTEMLGVEDSGSALKQYYAYAYLGGNSWIFIRIDFLRKSETEWVLSSFMFNSEYDQVIVPSFSFLE